jgi:hypothetical protein
MCAEDTEPVECALRGETATERERDGGCERNCIEAQSISAHCFCSPCVLHSPLNTVEERCARACANEVNGRFSPVPSPAHGTMKH